MCEMNELEDWPSKDPCQGALSLHDDDVGRGGCFCWIFSYYIHDNSYIKCSIFKKKNMLLWKKLFLVIGQKIISGCLFRTQGYQAFYQRSCLQAWVILSFRRLYVSAVTSCVNMTWPSPSVSTRRSTQSFSPSFAVRWLSLFWSSIWQTFPVVSGQAFWTSSVCFFCCGSSCSLFICWATKSNKILFPKI